MEPLFAPVELAARIEGAETRLSKAAGDHAVARQGDRAFAREIAGSIDEMAEPAPDPLQALIDGTRGFLDACLDPAVRRIYLIDAPAVLGWHRWREIDAPHGLRSLREGVAAVLAARPDQTLNVEPITFLLSGAFNEAALWIAEARDEKTARREMDRTLVQLMERLFGPPAEPARPPRARARA